MVEVDLGYLEECESWEVESRLFPSKVGGKPAWLDLENVPKVKTFWCDKCQVPMIFLCQIYAPYENDDENFHRTLFIFICRTPSCCVRNIADNIKVFRSSLPRKNKYYAFEPPQDEPNPEFSLGKWLKVCALCGCAAEKTCSNCLQVFYCCREHQVIDWKYKHKSSCQNPTHTSDSNLTPLLFPEYEMVIESERLQKKEVNEVEELEKFNQLKLDENIGTMSEISESELDEHALIASDQTFIKFQKYVKENPGQVLRYSRGGQPLWISQEPKPDVIPNCEYCKGPRQFECQIMPQMLAMLKEHELDWGVLVLYSCKQSCVGNTAYKNEYIFKQDISMDV